MSQNPLLELKAIGQHIWLDNLSRTLLREGGLQRLINEDGIDGVTSNPSIFEKAIANGTYYREDLERLRGAGLDAEACYESLVIADIRAACAMLLPAFRESRGEAGYVSLEVSPALADDTIGTVAAARRLLQQVGLDNVLIKVPATPSGIEAFSRLTAEGVSVNVTLIFSLAQYEAVVQAYLRGALRWLESGGQARHLRSVASVFLSRVDTAVDKRLDALGTMHAARLSGRSGVALAKCCHGRYRDIFHGPDFALLRLAGIRPQTPLWASTGSKNLAYSDVLYVEPLIGPESINTLPDATLAAFRKHGQVANKLKEGLDEAQIHVQALMELGIDLDAVGHSLQVDGVLLFAEAYQKILRGLKAENLTRTGH
ncbi:transaldolase [Ferribacterium limneticum]|uniref:transaldolase n=1 Tax=Ferribacterium limneticum TaxID=76259 RepID=UPI001CF8B728|nr:transaldolase [Ferribacterium limneticum]UCV24590.1 transaldolase [Ferribacterium limneticum]